MCLMPTLKSMEYFIYYYSLSINNKRLFMLLAQA